MIKVFHRQRTRSMRVLWMAEEMGLPYEVELVERGNPSPAFLAVNPARTLPAIVDGDVVITESVAILQYLADRYGPTELSVKPTEAGYSDYLQFLVLGEAGLAAPMNAVIGTHYFAPDEQKQNWTVDMVKEGFLRRMRLVEGRLHHPYLAGDRFTAADISVAYAIGLGKAFDLTDQIAPVVLDYYDRVTARPAYQRAAAI